MSVARWRALTQKVYEIVEFDFCVEMSVARWRALTHQMDCVPLDLPPS